MPHIIGLLQVSFITLYQIYSMFDTRRDIVFADIAKAVSHSISYMKLLGLVGICPFLTPPFNLQVSPVSTFFTLWIHGSCAWIPFNVWKQARTIYANDVILYIGIIEEFHVIPAAVTLHADWVTIKGRWQGQLLKCYATGVCKGISIKNLLSLLVLSGM